MGFFDGPSGGPQVVYGSCVQLSQGSMYCSTIFGDGGTTETPAPGAEFAHVGASIIMIRPDGDSQAAIAVGMAGYAVPGVKAGVTTQQ